MASSYDTVVPGVSSVEDGRASFRSLLVPVLAMIRSPSPREERIGSGWRCVVVSRHRNCLRIKGSMVQEKPPGRKYYCFITYSLCVHISYEIIMAMATM